MKFLNQWFGKKESKAPQQAVLVDFAYGSTDLTQLNALQDRLDRVIMDARVGEYDGFDMTPDGSEVTLYMYGDNADTLFAVVRPILEASPLTKSAMVTLQYGPPEDGVREETIRLDG